MLISMKISNFEKVTFGFLPVKLRQNVKISEKFRKISENLKFYCNSYLRVFVFQNFNQNTQKLTKKISENF